MYSFFKKLCYDVNRMFTIILTSEKKVHGKKAANMKAIRRMISIMLVLVMLAGMVPPTVVRAEETEATQNTSEAIMPTEETTAPTEEVTEPPVETTVSTEAVTEPTEETTVPTEETQPEEIIPEETISQETVEETVSDDAVDAVAIISGTCGENLTWKLLAGSLTISGEGPMDEYTSKGAPWYAHRKNIVSVTLEQGVTTISDYAFWNCANITKAEFPEGLLSIGCEAFYNCNQLKSITIPDSVTVMGTKAFWFCTALNSVTLGKGITDTGEFVFASCTSLSSVTIPEGVTTISKGAFSNCLSMTSVFIPTSTAVIGDSAFSYCKSLTNVYYAGTEEQWNSISLGEWNELFTSAAVTFGAGEIPEETVTPDIGVAEGFVKPIEQIVDADAIPEGYTAIYTESDLQKIQENPSGKYILMKNIDLKYTKTLCYDFNPFTGEFDGNGHTISGLKGTEWSGPTMYWGLFEAIDGAKISNLKIFGSFDVNIDYTRQTDNYFYLGALTGYATGSITITNCVNAVTFTCEAPDNDAIMITLGGLIGEYDGTSDNVIIDACRNVANIASIEDTGGIVGRINLKKGYLTIGNCCNDGDLICVKEVSPDDVSGLGGGFGGIVGRISGKDADVVIAGCLNNGDITVGSCGGGIVGSIPLSSDVTIASCANTGDITGIINVGGIVDSLADHHIVRDCLNTGAIKMESSFYFAGGIAAYGGTFYRCLNTGTVNTPNVYGKLFNCAIVDSAGTSVTDCYWLDDGQTNTLYGKNSDDQDRAIRTTGKLTKEELSKEENFQNFSFPDVWTMNEKLGHPVPTGLTILAMENTYQRAYIEKTDESLYDYKRVIGGSGHGSLAGVLGDAYERAHLDKVNGLWDAIQFVEGLTNYVVYDTSDYDVLLADLITGSVSREIRKESIVSSAFNAVSEITTLAGVELGATKILAMEKYLEDMAKLPTAFAIPAQELVEGIRGSAIKDIPLDKFGKYLDTFGKTVNYASAIAAGCKNTKDAFDFFCLCKTNADVVTSYGDVLLGSAGWTLTMGDLSSEEASELYKATEQFAEKMRLHAEDNPKALYEEVEGAFDDFLTVHGCTSIEAALSLAKLNPVLESLLQSAKLGISMGVPIADTFTKMDKIAYYGRMMDMCGTFSKGVFVEVQDRIAAYEEDPTFEKTQAMNIANQLYVNLQILACEYGIGYHNAIISSELSKLFHANMDDIASIIQLQAYQIDLKKLLDSEQSIHIGKDGSISGFIANCPVTVVVTDSGGYEVTRMKTGSITTDEEYAGNYMLLGDEGQHKAGLFDSQEHTVTLIGEDNGTMDLVVYFHTKDGTTKVDTYLEVPIAKNASFTVTEDGLVGETTVPPTKTEVYNPEDHIHAPGVWLRDEEQHWRICADCDERLDEGEHSGNSNCVICNCELYNPKPESLELSQQYIVLERGQTLTLASKVHPEGLSRKIKWIVDDDSVIAVDKTGKVTGKEVGTAYITISVTDGETTLTDRCRVDVVESIQLDGVQLSTTKLTTELYSTDYAEFDILLRLPQNYAMTASSDSQPTEDKNSGVAVERAYFTDEAVAKLFGVVVLDDRRVQVVPTDYAVKNPGEVKGSYTSTVTVVVQGKEWPSEELKLTVKKSMPSLKASIAAFNSFYTGQSQEIIISGGTPVAIYEDTSKNTAKTTALPNWLVPENGTLTLTENAPLKNASGKAYLLVETEEWRIPAALTLTVKNTYKTPGLKLSASAVTFTTLAESSNGVELKLLPNSKNDTLASLNVTGITAPKGYSIENFNAQDGSFTLKAKEDVVPGKIILNVSFSDTTANLPVTLTVKTEAVKLKLSKTNISLNTAVEDSAVIQVTATPADYRLDLSRDNVRLTDGTGKIDKTGEVEIEAEGDQITLKAVTGKIGTYKLYVSAGGSAEAVVTIKTISKAPAVTYKAKGNLDLSFPNQYPEITPTFQYYNGGFSIVNMTAVNAKKQDASGYFQTVRVGQNILVRCEEDTPLGSYTLTLKLMLANKSTVENTVKVTVKRTAVKLKLSSGKLTLNKSIAESGAVTVTCTTKGYDFAKPEWELMDKTGKKEAPGKLDIGYENGKLTVGVNEATEYGATYKILVKASNNDPAQTLTVTIPKKEQSTVTASLKISGKLDVIRDGSAITVTPSYKNCLAGTEKVEKLNIYEDGSTEPVTEQFSIQPNGKGGYSITRAKNAKVKHGVTYKVELVTTIGEVTLAPVSKTFKPVMGSAKLTLVAEDTTLFAQDKNDRVEFRFDAEEAALNEVERVEIKDAKYQDLFALYEYGNGEFAIGYKDVEAANALIGEKASKTETVTLNIFLEGNQSEKANTTVKLMLTVLK